MESNEQISPKYTANPNISLQMEKENIIEQTISKEDNFENKNKNEENKKVETQANNREVIDKIKIEEKQIKINENTISTQELDKNPESFLITFENKELKKKNSQEKLHNEGFETKNGKEYKQDLENVQTSSEVLPVIISDVTKTSPKKCVHCLNKEVTEIKREEKRTNSKLNKKLQNENTKNSFFEFNGINEVKGKIKEKFDKLEQLRKSLEKHMANEIKKPIKEENNYDFELYGKNHGQILETQKEAQREKMRQQILSNSQTQEKESVVPSLTSLPIYERPKINNKKELINAYNEQMARKERPIEKIRFNTSIDLLLSNNEKHEEKIQKKQKEGKTQLHKESLQVNENLSKRKEKILMEKSQERIHMEKSIEMFNKMKAEMEERRKNNSQKLKIDLSKQIIEKNVKDKIEKQSVNSLKERNNINSKILATKMTSSITSKDNPFVGLISPSTEQIINESLCGQCKKPIKNNI